MTPDTMLALFWVLSLVSYFTLPQRPTYQWLTGVFLGLGFLSKYTMAFFLMALGLYFLCNCKNYSRQKILSFATILLTFTLTISPHLRWNHANGWITMRAQLGHAFAGSISDSVTKDASSVFQPAYTPNVELKMATAFMEPGVDKISPPSHPVQKSWSRFWQYVTSQLGLWGLCSVALLMSVFKKPGSVPIHIRSELKFVTLFPLVFCAFVSLFNKVEANWPAMSLVTVSLVFINYIAQNPRLFFKACLFNIVLFFGIANFLLIKPSVLIQNVERLSQDTLGYDSLPNYISHVDYNLFAESYQTTSLLRWHGLTHVHQVPGLSRVSEFSRTEVANIDRDEVAFISRSVQMPVVTGFAPISLHQMYLCPSNMWHAVESLNIRRNTFRYECKKPLTMFYMAKYKRRTVLQNPSH
jgi:4-amino-4-deoxy-L-arabinose transferase-like glycosyltransferase